MTKNNKAQIEKRLNELSSRLTYADEGLNEWQDTRTNIRTEVFELFDLLVGELTPYDYPADDGMVLRRQIRTKRKLDEQALLADLTPKQRKLVVSEYIDPDKLAGAIAIGQIPAELVEKYSEEKLEPALSHPKQKNNYR